MHRDWIDYIAAAGSIATALTLIYLVIKEWKTRKHITDLKVLADEMKRLQVNMQEQNTLNSTQLKTSVRPNLAVASIEQNKKDISVTLINKGKVAFPVNFEYSGNAILHVSYLPFSLENDQT